MIKKLLSVLFIFSLFQFGESITKITYANSNCDSINAVERYQLSECRLMSLGGQLFSVKINICNSTSWQTFVYFNSVNCTEPSDLVSNGPSNRCFFSDSNLYEKIICSDIIGQQENISNQYFYLFSLFIIPVIFLLFW